MKKVARKKAVGAKRRMGIPTPAPSPAMPQPAPTPMPVPVPMPKSAGLKKGKKKSAPKKGY